MKNGHPVMDADIHVMEPADLYQKFMDPKWGDRIPRGSGERVSTGMYVYTTAEGTMVRTPPPEASRGRMTYLGADVSARLGDDLLLFSSDWPHGDAPYPHATEKVLAMEGVGDASKRKIMWDNPRRLYGMA